MIRRVAPGRRAGARNAVRGGTARIKMGTSRARSRGLQTVMARIRPDTSRVRSRGFHSVMAGTSGEKGAWTTVVRIAGVHPTPRGAVEIALADGKTAQIDKSAPAEAAPRSRAARARGPPTLTGGTRWRACKAANACSLRLVQPVSCPANFAIPSPQMTVCTVHDSRGNEKQCNPSRINLIVQSSMELWKLTVSRHRSTAAAVFLRCALAAHAQRGRGDGAARIARRLLQPHHHVARHRLEHLRRGPTPPHLALLNPGTG